MKKALITGITGQDGSYLAELLLEKGYEVHGIIRRASTFNTKRIDHLYQDPHGENVRLFLHYGDLTDTSNLNRLLEKIQPDEIYNLGAQSHVGVSFNSPEYTAEATGVSTLRILDAIRETGIKTKFYQASTSELFGGLPDTAPQSEKTHSIQKVHMELLNYTLIGLQSTTVNLMIFLHVMESYLTMNHHVVEKLSLLVKSHVLQQRFI